MFWGYFVFLADLDAHLHKTLYLPLIWGISPFQQNSWPVQNREIRDALDLFTRFGCKNRPVFDQKT
jgi:hypothetical protein